MPIRKGEAWGDPAPLPPHGVIVRSDAEARAIVTAARRAGEPVPPLGLLGGDLCRTLGGTGDEARLHGPEAMQLPVDLGAVLVDGRLHWFVAHLVARRGWWRGRVVAAMNAQFLGPWDVAPKGHPDDGRLDVLDADLPLGQRWSARRRLRHRHPRAAPGDLRAPRQRRPGRARRAPPPSASTTSPSAWPRPSPSESSPTPSSASSELLDGGRTRAQRGGDRCGHRPGPTGQTWRPTPELASPSRRLDTWATQVPGVSVESPNLCREDVTTAAGGREFGRRGRHRHGGRLAMWAAASLRPGPWLLRVRRAGRRWGRRRL